MFNNRTMTFGLHFGLGEKRVMSNKRLFYKTSVLSGPLFPGDDILITDFEELRTNNINFGIRWQWFFWNNAFIEAGFSVAQPFNIVDSSGNTYTPGIDSLSTNFSFSLGWAFNHRFGISKPENLDKAIEDAKNVEKRSLFVLDNIVSYGFSSGLTSFLILDKGEDYQGLIGLGNYFRYTFYEKHRRHRTFSLLPVSYYTEAVVGFGLQGTEAIAKYDEHQISIIGTIAPVFPPVYFASKFGIAWQIRPEKEQRLLYRVGLELGLETLKIGKGFLEDNITTKEIYEPGLTMPLNYFVGFSWRVTPAWSIDIDFSVTQDSIFSYNGFIINLGASYRIPY